MNQEITISDAKPEDALGITNVFYKAWLSTYPNENVGVTVEDIEDSYKDEFSDKKIKNLEKLIKESSKNKKRLVAKDGELIVGTCTLVINEDTNFLRTLYLLPEYQGKGIGTMLWNESKNFFDKNKDVFVEVAEYTKAVDFYKKLGFVDTGKRKESDDRFKSGAKIIEMEMKLDKSLL